MFLSRLQKFVRYHLPNVAIALGYHSRPRFLIVGAQKAGTTALYYYLAEHPNIIQGRDKEIGFFSPELFEHWPENPAHHILGSHDNITSFHLRCYHKQMVWYHKQFPLPHERGKSRITYEATPEYLYYPNAPLRIHNYDHNIKLIAILRNPVDRAFSAWNMYYREFNRGMYRRLRELRNFDEAIRDELRELSGTSKLEPGYVRRGIYCEQLTRYFKLFKRNQLLILSSQELRDNTSHALRRVSEFLELPEYSYPKAWPPYLVGTYDDKLPRKTGRLLRDFYKPFNEKLYEMLDRDFGWQ
jgi:Sulfotransferase domain